MISQIFQNSDTTTGCGVQYPLIHWRRFRELKEELSRDYKPNTPRGNMLHYQIKGIDVYIENEAVIAFESKEEDEGLLKKVLDFFDLPRDAKSKCIVAFPKEQA